MRIVIAAALSAAAIRLLRLGWLQPLNFDEIEFFRATDWVRRGLVPFRDFWEHHTPLQWYLFAPFSALVNGEGVGAVIAMRWMQVPLWILTFWLAMIWMRRLELERAARWTALAVALASTFLMFPAVEYRIDVLACTLYLAGLLCAGSMNRGRRWGFAAGVTLTLAAMANIRLGPLIAVTVILFAAIDPEAKRWRFNERVLSIFIGAAITITLICGYFAAAGALDEVMQQVWFQNYIGDKLALPNYLPFANQLSTMFGVLLRDTGPVFEPAAIDPGGIVLLLFGCAGVVLALRNWRQPDARFMMAVLQVVSVIFIARMKRVYNYHFEIAVVMMLPFVALTFARIRRKQLTFALVAVAWCVGASAALFRGKETELAWQDLVMKEVHARTAAAEKVWDGAGWALRREPAYRFWFLAELPQLLVEHGYAATYGLPDVLRDPPAAIIPDYYIRTWLARDRQLQRFVVTHYLPLWRDVWIPAPNGVLAADRPQMSWVVPRDGEYRLFAAARLAEHPWFRAPFTVDVADRPDAGRFPIAVRRPSAHPELSWSLDGQPVQLTNGVIRLRKFQRLDVRYSGRGRIALMLLPGRDVALFRQPPPGTTLEAAYYRPAHLPRFHVRLR